MQSFQKADKRPLVLPARWFVKTAYHSSIDDYIALSICLTLEVGRQDTAPTVPVNKVDHAVTSQTRQLIELSTDTIFCVNSSSNASEMSNDMLVDGEDDTCVSNSMLEI